MRSQAQLEDFRFTAEVRRTFKGSARVSLDVLHFERNEHRDLDPKQVEYLKGCFQKDRCRRLEVRNRIEAVIDERSLDAALHISGISATDLLTNPANKCPKLDFPQGFQLRCLHGLHRIQAAREFLFPPDRWWTVDLYTTDLNEDLKQCFKEQHSKEAGPSDGEAYCKIRHYHFQGDTKSEMRWKAGLRGSRLKNLKELLADKDLTAGFDALLDIPGLWGGMRFTTLQKVMAMGFKNKILNYLGRIKKVFSGLVGGGKPAMMKIDRVTVMTLEMRYPRESTADRRFLQKQLRDGAIFSAFSSYERDQISERIEMVEGLIPSLYTFFRDIQYMQLCMDCLKRLAIVPRRQGVCETIQQCYTGINQEEGEVKIQVTEDTFIRKPGNNADRIDLGCRQLVAFAMRDYHDMPRDPVKKDVVQRATKRADPNVLRRLADLAYQLGFDTPQIRTLKQYPNSQPVQNNHSQWSPPHITSGSGIDIAKRSGIPHVTMNREARNFLFINHLHDKTVYQVESITSFFIHKSVYLAFFGRPNELSEHDTTASHRSPNSPCDSIRDDASQPQGHATSHSQGMPEHIFEDIDDIVSSYNRPENTSRSRRESEERREGERLEREELSRQRLEREKLEEERREQERQEQERQEQERQEREISELRRLEKDAEFEELQEKLAEALKAQEKLNQESYNEQVRKKRELERQEEEFRRQGMRERGRLEEAEALKDSEPARKRYAPSNTEGLIPGGAEGTGVELDPQAGGLQAHSGDYQAGQGSLVPYIPPSGEPIGRQQVLTPNQERSHFARLTYMTLERGVWKISHTLDVDPSDPSEAERIAVKYMRKQIRLFDTEFNILTPRDCVRAARDGSNTILLIPETDIDVSEQLEISVAKLRKSSTDKGRKRGRGTSD